MSDSAPPSTPPQVPGYELLRCIGRGSYGEVWLARDGSGAFCAVKIVYRNTFEHDRPYERELSGIEKFEPISRRHPSQVAILHVGRNVAQGYFYYVMELADPVEDETERGRKGAGEEIPFSPSLPFSPASYVPRTLKSELTRRGPLSFSECLDIGLALATALEHLHEHGLIHRDIKPSNVIFVRGVPKLADIGLVTDAGASISFVGTEGFLPPEGPGTPQADLYSLGKVLYEISTGRDRMDFPDLPTFVDQPAHKEHLLELNQIFLKACQNEPRRRYQSARDLASDLELLRSGKSLRRARAVGQRLAQARLLAGAAVLVVLGAALANHFLQQRRVNEAQREQARQEKEAEIYRRAEAHKTRRLADSYAASGQTLEAQGDYPGALLRFSKALAEEHSDPARAGAHRRQLVLLWQQTPPMPALFAHTGPVNAARFSGDGRRAITASDDRTARVYEMATGEAIGPPLSHSSQVLQAELSADGDRALTLAADGVARLWSSLAADPVAAKLEFHGRCTFAALSPNGRQLLTVTDGPEALLWEASSRRVRFTLKHPARILCATFSADGRFVATGSADRTARIWDTETGQMLATPLAHEGPVTHLAFSVTGRRLATADGARARVWAVRSAEPALFTLRHDDSITSLAFSPDEKRILTSGKDMTARVWDAIRGELLATPFRHAGVVHQAVFSPDGRSIATADDQGIRLWSAHTFQLIPPWFVHNGAVQQVQFNPAGDCLLTASTDGTARVLNIADADPSLARSNGPQPTPDAGAVRPAPDTDETWTLLAQVFSGRRISDDERAIALPPEVHRGQWQRLKTKFPCAVAPVELPQWHQRMAETCEASRDWSGAAFHWERALGLCPGVEQFRTGRDRAARELALSELALSRRETLPPERLPARPPDARPPLLDLSPHYNAALTETWLPTNVVASGNDLSALPRGVLKFGGVEFDARGIVQLSGGALENLGGRFPREITGIQVGQRCRKIHFLHGAAWSARAGTHIGSYLVHYAGGESREIKILFGRNVREWLAPPAPQLITGAAVAWEGHNTASRALGLTVKLYQMTWLNPLPDVGVQRLDFRSTMENPAPFLIAITVE